LESSADEVALLVSWETPDVRFGSKADILGYQRDVRFTPKSGHG
jgi:hypothetical protein